MIFVSDLRASDAEKSYREQRDKFYKQFSNESCEGVKKEEEVALKTLEKTLQDLLGVNGKINLTSLNKGCKGYADSPSFLDGLWFNQKNEGKVFVTTKGIMDDYFADEKNSQKELTNFIFPKCLICYDAFGDQTDAGILIFAPLITKEDKKSGAFLVSQGQDFTPVPTAIIIYAIKGEKLFLEFVKLPTKFAKISECKNEWNQIFSRYDDDIDEENTKYLQYGNCFIDKVKNQKFYLDILSKAREIMDHL